MCSVMYIVWPKQYTFHSLLLHITNSVQDGGAVDVLEYRAALTGYYWKSISNFQLFPLQRRLDNLWSDQEVLYKVLKNY